MHSFFAGDNVEIADPSHRCYRRRGTVRFLVGDNVYVRLPHLRFRSTRVFFPEQLRSVYVEVEQPAVARRWFVRLLRLR